VADLDLPGALGSNEWQPTNAGIYGRFDANRSGPRIEAHTKRIGCTRRETASHRQPAKPVFMRVLGPKMARGGLEPPTPRFSVVRPCRLNPADLQGILVNSGLYRASGIFAHFAFVCPALRPAPGLVGLFVTPPWTGREALGYCHRF
jgi:hypothetical protein